MRNSGFTLIEILVVITLGAILSTAGFLSYNNYQIRRSVELSLQELSSTVEQVQRKSVTQEDGNRWSIRFTATSTGEDTYSIYRGDTYSTGSTTQSYSFKRAVHFSEPSGDRSVDFNFEPISGKVDNKKIITITNDSPHQIAGDVIVNTLGVVTEKMRDNIVGYWHLDEGSSATTTDASGEENNGSINGATWVSGNSCIAGNCLDFDGTDDYIQLSNLNLVTDSNEDEYTLSAWVKTNGIGSLQGIVGLSTYNGMFVCSDGGFSVQSDGDNAGICPAGTEIDDGNWHNIVTIYIEGERYIGYKDGEQVFNVSTSDTEGSNSQSAVIANRVGQTDYFDGIIDEVKVYNTALSSSTIKDNYNDLK